jgi:lipopolysaccharide transport system ATP-binding protein
MSEIAIKAEGLGKSFLVGHNVQREQYVALRDVLARNVKGLVRKTCDMLSGRPIIQGDEIEEFWALRDVDFEIKRGDRVGIVGRNGAGKSTLLKVLSRITEPTTGRVTLNGRVASLLEVGTGFHPELSGRENIYLNGAILGMSRQEIRRKFDEMVAFAEVEKFLDTPVKRYSSGMYVRLAFSVAAHLDPEILIVDEVLAVGDAQFQKKCLGKMEHAGRAGSTVLFVSHNMAAVQTLCNTGISLDGGRVVKSGTIDSVVEHYLSSGAHGDTARRWDEQDAPGNDDIRLRSICVVPTSGRSEHWTVHTPLDVEFCYQLLSGDSYFYIGFHLRTITGDCIFVTASTPVPTGSGSYRSVCHIPGDLLNAGVYTIHAYFVRDGSNVLLDVENPVMFEIHDVERAQGAWMGSYPGAVRPLLQWVRESE